MQLSGQRALVTGASGGLGWCFAEQLAQRGASLVLTARRKDRLEELAAHLRSQHETEVLIIEADLSLPQARQTLFEQTEGQSKAIDILVNNAGIGIYSTFCESKREDMQRLLQVNINALTELTWLFAKQMKSRHHGYILNVASLVAYLPVAYYSTYAASKAYVRSFSHVLSQELRPFGVHVLCLCPGSINTAFWNTSGHQQLPWLVRKTMTKPERVAKVGLQALLGHQHNRVVGGLNRLGVFLSNFLSNRILVWLTQRLLSKSR